MGFQHKINQALKKDAKEADKVLFKKRQAFTIEIDFLNAYYGRRFKGKLTFSKNGIKPSLSLERAPIKRIKEARENQAKITKEVYSQIGLDVTVPPKPDIFAALIMYIPVMFDWIVARYAKKKMMEQYREVCLRHRCIYFSFIAEHNGEWVPAIDIRDLTDEEWRGLGGTPSHINKAVGQEISAPDRS